MVRSLDFCCRVRGSDLCTAAAAAVSSSMMVKIDSSSRPRPPKSANPPFLGPDRGRSQADAAPGRAGDGHGEEESRADSKNASLSKVRGCGRFPFLVAPRLQLYFANWLNTETRQPPADKNGDRRSALTAPHPPFWRACVRPPWAPVTPPFSTRSDPPPRALSLRWCFWCACCR